MITFEEYQEKVRGFMRPKTLENQQDTLMNAVLGLSGEAGEVADLIKKHLFHDQELDLEKLDKEVGDAQFYIALYAIARNRQLADIAQMNVDKLTARAAEHGGKAWRPKVNETGDIVVTPTGTATCPVIEITSIT